LLRRSPSRCRSRVTAVAASASFAAARYHPRFFSPQQAEISAGYHPAGRRQRRIYTDPPIAEERRFPPHPPDPTPSKSCWFGFRAAVPRSCCSKEESSSPPQPTAAAGQPAGPAALGWPLLHSRGRHTPLYGGERRLGFFKSDLYLFSSALQPCTYCTHWSKKKFRYVLFNFIRMVVVLYFLKVY
jgi:hypothetical protein